MKLEHDCENWIWEKAKSNICDSLNKILISWISSLALKIKIGTNSNPFIFVCTECRKTSGQASPNSTMSNSTLKSIGHSRYFWGTKSRVIKLSCLYFKCTGRIILEWKFNYYLGGSCCPHSSGCSSSRMWRCSPARRLSPQHSSVPTRPAQPPGACQRQTLHPASMPG